MHQSWVGFVFKIIVKHKNFFVMSMSEVNLNILHVANFEFHDNSGCLNLYHEP